MHKISDLFQIQKRYLRSAHLERDFLDESALQGYILTPQTQNSIKRIATGLSLTSSQRAWRITGDYGCGKSSFAIFLARLFAAKKQTLPAHLQNIINFKELGLPSPKLLPVLVTGSREPLNLAVLRSLRDTVLLTCDLGRLPKVVQKINKLLDTSVVLDTEAVELVLEVNTYIDNSGKANGLLIIVDELGKFLEFAALYPDRQDIYFLQKLAEVASRSGKKPLFVVGLLHQGFNAYAEQLSPLAQKEWEKVAGRFEELLFNQPLEYAVTLVADALNMRPGKILANIIAQEQQDMDAVINLGWYGHAASKKSLLKNACRIYPLHPTVISPLVNAFSRFGQNERSLFSFLLSNEPFALQDFSSQPIDTHCFYRIHNLYDYVRVTFGHRLSIQSYRSHWNLIDSVIESFPASNDLELKVLKTVGLLNLLDANNMIASEEAIVLAIAGSNEAQAHRIKTVIKKLQKENILYFRGIAGGFCLWPHTSVNLEKAYEDASKTIGQSKSAVTAIQCLANNRSIVARRHYIETGNLRYFDVKYLSVQLLKDFCFRLDGKRSSDGLILVPLCETLEEHKEALEVAKNEIFEKHTDILIAVPKPLSSLSKLVQEVQRWQWVAENTPELNNDSYAAEEVSRQIAASRRVLEKRVQNFIGIQNIGAQTELKWFYRTNEVNLISGRALLAFLSNICDKIYDKAPKIINELVNRADISSAAASARRRLIERIYDFSTEPLLGMDATKKPPEMSIYLSILKNGCVHIKNKADYFIVAPEKNNDPNGIRPALERILEILQSKTDSRVVVSEIFVELRKKPFGIRDGLLPILLAIFAKIYEQDLAFYENGSFLRHLSGNDYLRIIKAPEVFELQYCKITGIRTEVFNRLLNILGLKPSAERKAELLDVVRPLCVFVAQLPDYAHKTKNLSEKALAVRSALLQAREPSTLIFRDLPCACGLKAFSVTENVEAKFVQIFVDQLKNSLDELKTAHLELLERIKRTTVKASGLPGVFFDVRKSLACTSEEIIFSVTEPRLKAFCIRLNDSKLSEQEWLESLGSFVCSKPPSKWNDADEDTFCTEIKTLLSRFTRVESIAFKKGKNAKDDSAVRLSITRADGSELDKVLHFSRDEEKDISKIENEVSKILEKNKRVGMAAVSLSLWKALQQDDTN